MTRSVERRVRRLEAQGAGGKGKIRPDEAIARYRAREVVALHLIQEKVEAWTAEREHRAPCQVPRDVEAEALMVDYTPAQREQDEAAIEAWATPRPDDDEEAERWRRAMAWVRLRRQAPMPLMPNSSLFRDGR